MKIAIVTFVPMLFATVATSTAAGPIDTNAPDWGEPVNGLEMAASVDKSIEVIHCWVRNGTTNRVDYNSFWFGYFESVEFEIREGTNWLPIKSAMFPGVTFPGPGFISSAGPTGGDVRSLQPGQVITDTWSRRLSQEIYQRGPNQTLSISPRDQLLWKVSQRDTFAVDLLAVRWPADALQRPSLTVRICQSFCPAKEPKMGTIYSPVFVLDDSMLESLRTLALAGTSKSDAEVIPRGSLGHRLGKYLTIEGVRAEADQGKVGVNTLLVDTVNGKKLDTPVGVWVENVHPLPKATRCILRGYESGRMIGVPGEVAEKEHIEPMQARWQFYRYFIVTSVVQPKDLTLIAPRFASPSVRP
jgi:hypothetical protein